MRLKHGEKCQVVWRVYGYGDGLCWEERKQKTPDIYVRYPNNIFGFRQDAVPGCGRRKNTHSRRYAGKGLLCGSFKQAWDIQCLADVDIKFFHRRSKEAVRDAGLYDYEPFTDKRERRCWKRTKKEKQ